MEIEDILGSLLTTEEGQNLTEVLADLKSEVVHQLTVQNKILLKLLGVLTPKETKSDEARNSNE